MKVLIIVSHHNDKSLTFAVKSQVEKGLTEIGHTVDTLDLYKINFNPVFTQADEPDRSEIEQNYGEDVVQEMERLQQYDAVAFVFPMYWGSMPAMMKGYIDRVWNYNFAHGPHRNYLVKKVLWVTTAGAPAKRFENDWKYGNAIEHYFNDAIAGYCRIDNSKFKMLANILSASKQEHQVNLEEAYQEGLTFDTW